MKVQVTSEGKALIKSGKVLKAKDQGRVATEPFIEETYDASGNLTGIKMYGHTKVRTYAFYLCDSLESIELPSGLTSIDNYAFNGCTKLALASLPSGITSIGAYAFTNCTGLITLTFKGTPTSISSSAFNGCTNLTDIYVPWAEGAVANAPWGATNATIHYNTTP